MLNEVKLSPAAPEHDPYEPNAGPLLVIISGPSGVGKDSVVQRMQKRGTQFYFVVTATSRAPRPGEVHGVDYYFVTEATFHKMIEEDELIEHALVYGQHKGIPKQQVRDALNSGMDVVMRLDVQGAATVKQLIPEAVTIFLSASSEDELISRLHKRKSDSPDQIQRRIETVQQEMKQLAYFDYAVINRDCQLDAAVDDILCIIRAEHQRVHRRQVKL
ncbi:MAG: guanylate kinase [Anaerolineae bacterium]|nr:guanylate kinase [Anaerolineae bacterium]